MRFWSCTACRSSNDVHILPLSMSFECNLLSGYVSTRYYRAPEIMLTWQKYDVAGKINSNNFFKLASSWLVERRLYFCWNAWRQAVVSRERPYIDHVWQQGIILDVHQFQLITELLGSPGDDILQTICSENVTLFHHKYVLSLVRLWNLFSRYPSISEFLFQENFLKLILKPSIFWKSYWFLILRNVLLLNKLLLILILRLITTLRTK